MFVSAIAIPVKENPLKRQIKTETGGLIHGGGQVGSNLVEWHNLLSIQELQILSRRTVATRSIHGPRPIKFGVY